MTGKRQSGGRHAGPLRIMTAAAAAVLVIALALMLSACSGNDAEAKVKEELDRLKSSETAAANLESVKKKLPEGSGDDFDAFMDRVRDFDYKIIGSEAVSEEGEECTVVDVKITGCDFGKEYISTWKDYLKTHKNASAEDAEGNEFLTELFARLSKLEKKDHISFVEIRVYDSEDGLTTDIQTSEELQDAVFGGMIGEMKALAGE